MFLMLIIYIFYIIHQNNQSIEKSIENNWKNNLKNSYIYIYIHVYILKNFYKFIVNKNFLDKFYLYIFY